MVKKHIDSRESKSGGPARPKFNKKQKKEVLSEEEKDRRQVNVENKNKDIPVFWRDDFEVPGHIFAAKITINKMPYYIVPNTNSKCLVSDGDCSMVHLTRTEYEAIVDGEEVMINTAVITVHCINHASVLGWKKKADPSTVNQV